jgi:hypothetical protein
VKCRGGKKALKGWGQDQPSLVQPGARPADEVMLDKKYKFNGNRITHPEGLLSCEKKSLEIGK